MNPPTAHQVLQHMQVPRMRGMFVLGCFERRVTLYSQQVRALNLIHSLFELELLRAGSSLLVIGGGGGGLTAAAGAAVRGCKVTLLEKRQELLPLFTGNQTRWIHPHIYEWPAPDSTREQADLPVLDWRAAMAGDVAEQLMQAWTELQQSRGIRVLLGVERIRPRYEPAPPHRVSWNATGHHSESFDAVVLAVGFGLEKQQPERGFRSYWETDSLHQPIGLPAKPEVRVLVSGTGDGGLVDLFRLTLRGFRHDRIVADFLSQTTTQRLKEELLAIDKAVQRDPRQEASLYERYAALEVPEELDAGLKQRLRSGIKVTLNGRMEDPLRMGSSILNRFLASRLLKLGVNYREGALHYTGAPYEVSIGLDPPESFDLIVARHGPEKPALQEAFPRIWDEMEEHTPLLNTLDQTRVPMWTEGSFGSRKMPSPSGNPTPAPQLPEKGYVVGRSEEIDSIAGALLAPRPRPTMVLGAPGIGKSTILRAVLHDPRIEAHYGRNRYFVRLDGAMTADAMVASIARALDIPLGEGLISRVETALGASRTLLMLDNAESPWLTERPAVETWLQKLAGLPQLALVASIRRNESPDLREFGVHVVRVAPLTREETLKLFCSIATEVPQNHPLLPRLVDALGRMPLAVVLMAREAEGVELSVIRERWDREHTKMLARGHDRDTSLPVSIELSLTSSAVTEEARRLMSLLALFPAGVALEDRKRLFPDSAAAIACLQKAALVQGDGDRWRILAPIREHVHDTRLPPPEERKHVVSAYFERARSLGTKIGYAEGQAAMRQLGAEIDNLEALLLKELEGGDASEAIETVLQLNNFIRYSGQGTFAPTEQAVEVAKHRGDAGLQARCMLAFGRLLLRRLRYAEAQKYFQDAVVLFEQTGDAKGHAQCLQDLGSVSLILKQPENAWDYFQQARSFRKRAKDARGEAYSLHNLGRAARYLNRLDEARQRLEESLHMFEQQEDLLGQAYCLRHLGELNSDVHQLTKSCTLFEQVGEIRNLGHGHRSLGDLARSSQKLDEATAHYEKSIACFRQVHAHDEEAQSLMGLADIARMRHQLAKARTLLTRTLQLLEKAGDATRAEECRTRLAELEDPAD